MKIEASSDGLGWPGRCLKDMRERQIQQRIHKCTVRSFYFNYNQCCHKMEKKFANNGS